MNITMCKIDSSGYWLNDKELKPGALRNLCLLHSKMNHLDMYTRVFVCMCQVASVVSDSL